MGTLLSLALLAVNAAGEDVGLGTLAWETLKAVFFLLPLGLSLWAFLDVARRPSWAWALSGRNRIVWLVAIAFGVLTVVGGIAISCWYLLRVRPAVAAVEDGQLPD
ncbi:MAG: hypothetical protein KDB10_08755 [Acidimicrobiales bacterium]|nr:hypothetical protein [Acidimicrobiales bacterium]MCB9371438.1 hypothetical protein [Microthrixaceae bacterium]